METDRGINQHRNNSYEYHDNYMLHARNVQNDKPIDLTNGNSGRNTYVQKSGACRKSEMLMSNNPAYFHNVDNQGEVLKAAKSLFSKRTRTLYHWMYPQTPKFQLKSAIALAWDTMGIQEKQFYISQVLGKFGYLQNSLMVNPQLGCMSLIPLNIEHPDLSNVETRNAVSNLLQDGSSSSTWPQLPTPPQTYTRKRGRPRGSKGCTLKPKKQFKNGKPNEEDDFTDDPELRRELEQFQWALHMVEK